MKDTGFQLLELNALVYDIAYNLTHEAIRMLPKKFSAIVVDERKTRNFCNNATFGTKVEFLYAVGVKPYITFAREDNSMIVNFKQILSNYKKGKVSAALSEVVNKSILVTSSKNTLQVLALMSQSINTESYLSELLLNKTGFNARGWDPNYEPEGIEERKEKNDFNFKAAQVIKRAIGLGKMSEGFLSITENDLMLLLHFYTNCRSFKPITEIIGNFKSSIYSMNVGKCLRNLISEDYVLAIGYRKNAEYSISGKGIMAVEKFINKINDN